MSIATQIGAARRAIAEGKASPAQQAMMSRLQESNPTAYARQQELIAIEAKRTPKFGGGSGSSKATPIGTTGSYQSGGKTYYTQTKASVAAARGKTVNTSGSGGIDESQKITQKLPQQVGSYQLKSTPVQQASEDVL